jgi:ADP-heptose:LPS heptosyltransferase
MAEQRILIVRLGAFGDIIHTLPAAATIRENCPHSQITWMVESRWLPLLEGNPDVDDLLPFDRASVATIFGSIRQLRARSIDLAIDFQGLIKSAAPSWLSGARMTYGYSQQAARESVAANFYTHTLTPTSRHIVDQHPTEPIAEIHDTRSLKGDAVGGRE